MTSVDINEINNSQAHSWILFFWSTGEPLSSNKGDFNKFPYTVEQKQVYSCSYGK